MPLAALLEPVRTDRQGNFGATEDYWGVVISGVAVNVVPGGTEVPLPVGSYWFQKGGERHITKCISPNECIFFINQSGSFDYIGDPAK